MGEGEWGEEGEKGMGCSLTPVRPLVSPGCVSGQVCVVLKETLDKGLKRELKITHPKYRHCVDTVRVGGCIPCV